MRKVSVDVLVCFFGHLRPSHCLGNGKQCYSTHHSSLKHVCVWHSGDKRLGGITGILLKVKRVLSRSDVTTWLLCFPLMLDESEAANMVGKACKPQMELKRKGQKPAHTFKTNVFTLSGISSRLQRRTSWISEQWVVSLGLEAYRRTQWRRFRLMQMKGKTRGAENRQKLKQREIWHWCFLIMIMRC